MSARLLFATGGTGGHIFPALAIAKEAAQHYQIAFIGQKTGMEAKLVPEAGFDFFGVQAGKWDRSRPNPLEALRATRGLLEALNIVRAFKPDLVLGFGGFASFPGIAAAKMQGLPYLLNETNALPGKVTRWFAQGAAKVIVTQAAALEQLPKTTRSAVVGFPVRETKVARLEARKQLGLPLKGLLTFIMGGSQGSVVLNEQVPLAFEKLAASVTVLHSSGLKWESHLLSTTQSLNNYHVRGFVDASLAWSASDLAITRAGFGTLAEAAFHGVPVIMIPLASAAENHQLHNAKAVAAAGAGWVLEEKALDRLAVVWQNALDDEARSTAAKAALALSPAGATGRFVTIIAELLEAKRKPALQRGSA